MKTSKTFHSKEISMRVRSFFKRRVTRVVFAIFGTCLAPGFCIAQEFANDEPGVEVLTRGPVHEAFAGIITYNPVPGVLVQKAPPEVIEEIPPGERPEGDNITWIPGYWAWDDDRSDYLWVSGTWRALPPGRQWVSGYWGQTTQGHQWTSGYWADATVLETTYLPAPPDTLEDGPNTQAPSRDHSWTPGNWMWRQERYAWSPGYWAQGRSDWDWVPAHYVWTRRGYIYVDGYWDYSISRRGMLFAPVYFNSGIYSRPGYSYSPSIVLGLAMFAEHLFLRPKYHHYYFGDYYDNGYNRNGYYAAYSYQSSRYGYDPIYSRQRWEHREDRDWDQRARDNYHDRRDHEDKRPARTWTAMRTLDANKTESPKNTTMMAESIAQLAQRKDGSVRFQSVAKEDRKKLAQRGQEMRKTSNERRTLEAKDDSPESNKKPGDDAKTTKVKQPKSPIVAMPSSQFKKGQDPPDAQRSPEPKKEDQQPKSENDGRQPKIDKKDLQPEPRKPEADKKDIPKKIEETPREKQMRPERPTKEEEKKVQPIPERPQKVAPEKSRVKPESPKKEERKVQPEPKHRVKETPEKVKEQPSRKDPEKAPPSEPRKGAKEDPSPQASEPEQPSKKEHKKNASAE